MPSFTSDLQQFTIKLPVVCAAVFNDTADAIYGSIVNGSPVTAAPGQPVDTGNLRASWANDPIEPFIREITTNVVYAQGIEEGVVALRGQGNVTGSTRRALTLRSAVGGFHSVKMTRANWELLLEQARAAHA